MKSTLTVQIELEHDQNIPDATGVARHIASVVARDILLIGNGNANAPLGQVFPTLKTSGRRSVVATVAGPGVVVTLQSAVFSRKDDTSTVEGIVKALTQHVGHDVIVSGPGGSRQDAILSLGQVQTARGIEPILTKRTVGQDVDTVTGENLLIAYGGFAIRRVG